MGTEDLLASLGFGGITLHQVFNRQSEEIRLASAIEAPTKSNGELAAEVAAQAETLLQLPTDGAGVARPIPGLEDLDYHLGGCYSPLPGEPIVGSVSLSNHGVTIHRQDCGNVQHIPLARHLPVRWNPASETQQLR